MRSSVRIGRHFLYRHPGGIARGMDARISAGIFGFAGVALGAFGAHGLRQSLDEAALSTYQTAVFYHLVHAGVLLSLALQSSPRIAAVRWAERSLGLGILLFCGSLYLLAVTGLRALGWLTPLGGLCFLAGWAALAASGFKTQP